MSKIVFIAFAKEDESVRNLFTGQRINAATPFEFIDLSVKEAYVSGWKDAVRTRIKRSAGVIVLISSNTATAEGQLWEIACAVDEGKPLVGVWVDDSRVKPVEMGNAPVYNWSWENVAAIVDGF